MSHDVFISYSSDDKVVADAACAALEQRRIRCWIAPRDVPPGTPWASALVDAIRESRVLVLILSRGSNGSGQVIREVDEAVNDSVPIVPLRIDDVVPSEQLGFYIRSIHWLDALTPPMERHLEHLADSVEALLGVAEVHPTPPDPLPPPARVVESGGESTTRRLLIGGAIGLAVVLFTAAALLLGGRNDSQEASSDTETTLDADRDATAASDDGLWWNTNPATGHEYALTERGLSPQELYAVAARAGGYLVTINDEAEAEWLNRTFGPNNFWIGLTDKDEEGVYAWDGGEPVDFVKWCPGEPSDTEADGSIDEDAVYVLWGPMCWVDEAIWTTEFLAEDTGGVIGSWPGVIEVEPREG